MMRWLNLSPRGRTILIVAFLLALVATLPLRMVFALAGAETYEISARSISGPVWWGAAEELQAGPVRIGTVDVRLSPLRLLLGQARFDIRRKKGLPDDMEGALVAGIATQGMEGMTGTLPMGGALAPLPITAVEMQGVSIAFSGSRCVRAEGRVRALLSAGIPGLNLSNGLSGELRCEGTDLLIPLVSQSGSERIDLRLSGGGRYQGAMSISTTDPAISAGLGTLGFQPVGGNQLLRINGTL